MPVVGGNDSTSNGGALPDIVMVNFSGGDVELAMQARQQRFEPSAFFFEGSAPGDMNLEG